MIALSNNKKIISILSFFFLKYKKIFLVLLMLLLVEGFVIALSVFSVVPFSDFIFDTSLSDPSQITIFFIEVFAYFDINRSFWAFGVIFVSLNLISAAIKVIIRYQILLIKYSIFRGIAESTLSAILGTSGGFFNNHTSGNGRLLNTLGNESSKTADAFGHVATFFAQLIQLSIYMLVPLFLNLTMALIAFTIAGLFVMIFVFLSRKSYEYGKLNTKTANVQMNILNETIHYIKIIIGYSREEAAKEKYLKSFDNHAKITIKSQTLSNLLPLLFIPLGVLAAVVSYGISLDLGYKISELSAVLWSLLVILPVVSSVIQASTSVNNFIPSYEQLEDIKKLAKENKPIEGNKKLSNIKKVEFSNLSFAYHKTSKNNVLKEINLTIDQGEKVGLIGKSGSGKSTIIDLLIGIQRPNSGGILFDDCPLSNYTLSSIREKIGYVPQDSILFNTTIKNNLLWAQPNASDQEIKQALKLSNSEEFVSSLREGIDYVVGDRGSNLSGGQRQRIALARAIIRKPDLLILDEATSALDKNSEMLINNAINSLTKISMLIVSHNLKSIEKMDRIYYIEEGRVSEISKNELHKMNLK